MIAVKFVDGDTGKMVRISLGISRKPQHSDSFVRPEWARDSIIPTDVLRYIMADYLIPSFDQVLKRHGDMNNEFRRTGAEIDYNSGTSFFHRATGLIDNISYAEKNLLLACDHSRRGCEVSPESSPYQEILDVNVSKLQKVVGQLKAYAILKTYGHTFRQTYYEWENKRILKYWQDRCHVNRWFPRNCVGYSKVQQLRQLQYTTLHYETDCQRRKKEVADKKETPSSRCCIIC